MTFPLTEPATSVFALQNTDGSPRRPGGTAFRWGTEIERLLMALIAGAGDLALPNLLVSWQITGGDGNDIEATPSVDHSPGQQLHMLTFAQANTGPMTLDGKPLLLNNGEPVPADYVVPGTAALFRETATDYRFLTYGDPEAVQAAVEQALADAIAAKEAAEAAYTALATGVVPFGPWEANGSQTAWTLPLAPIVSGNCAVFLSGVFQDYAARSTAGTTLTFAEPPPEGSVISGVIFAPVDDLATPPAGSVSATAIDSGDVVNLRTALGIIEGSWTPTLTNVANVTASTHVTANFERIGNRVHCWGVINIHPTAASNTVTTIRMSLPIASNIASGQDGSGILTASGPQRAGPIDMDTASDTARLRFWSEVTANTTFSFDFNYKVI